MPFAYSKIPINKTFLMKCTYILSKKCYFVNPPQKAVARVTNNEGVGEIRDGKTRQHRPLHNDMTKIRLGSTRMEQMSSTGRAALPCKPWLLWFWNDSRKHGAALLDNKSILHERVQKTREPLYGYPWSSFSSPCFCKSSGFFFWHH